MNYIVIEQTKDYKKRIAYDPKTNTFSETENDCLFAKRGFIHPYGWLKGSGTPPGKHLDVFLLSHDNCALGDELEIKIVGVLKRADGDHKLVGILSKREETDFSQLPNNEKDDLHKLYPYLGSGEGWFGEETANAVIAEFESKPKKRLPIILGAIILAVLIAGFIVSRTMTPERVYLWGDAELTGFSWDESYFWSFGERIQIPNSVPHGEIAVSYIRHINDYLYGRVAFTYREKYKARWIVEELLSMGFSWDDIEIQEFDFEDVSDILFNNWGWTWQDLVQYGIFRNLAVRSPRTSQNVVLTIPGQSDRVIIVGAHYDSYPYAGANDNASGTALLLESAKRMRELDNYYTIVYVFFGAHEVGMLGAYYYAGSLSPAQHENILFMINADVIITGPYMFYAAGFDDNGESGVNHITQTWDNIAAELYNSQNILISELPNFIFAGADQRAFLPHGHTVMFMMSALRVNVNDEGIIQSVSIPRHHPEDCYHYLNETQPGRIVYNMRAYSLFLEKLLLARYY